MSGSCGMALALAAKDWAHERSYWGWRFSPPGGNSSFLPPSASAHSLQEPSIAENSPHKDPWSTHLIYCFYLAADWK